MVQRIVIFAEDSGAANAARAINTILGSDSYEVENWITGAAQRSFLNAGIDFCSPPKDGLSGLSSEEQPDLIIVGTSENPDSLGLKIIDQAEELGIFTLGVVDQAMNVEGRFKGNDNDPLRYLPTKVLVPDRYTRDGFVKLGVGVERLVVTGYTTPLLVNEWLSKASVSLDPASAVSGRLEVIFVAEGYDRIDPRNSMKNEEFTLHGESGSSFRSVIVMEELRRAVKACNANTKLSVRLHPNSVLDDFEPAARDFDLIAQEKHPYESILTADLVVGMTSMLLFEAHLLGLPTLSILPLSREREWMPNTATGMTPVASTREELKYFLDKGLVPRGRLDKRSSEDNTRAISAIIRNTVDVGLK